MQNGSKYEGKKITCKAAVVWEENTPFVIETVEIDPPKTDEVRIKMTSSGLCHSDCHFQEGCLPNYPFPALFGHEGAGIIESVGPEVKDLAPGDCVLTLFIAYCGECVSCKSEKSNTCRKQPINHFLYDGTSRISCKGKYLSQFFTTGTFSEYTVVSEKNCAKISPEVPMNKIAVASCCVLTGYGAAQKCAKVEPGSTCAVWGLGGVGMNVVLGCKAAKASKIIEIDLCPEKFNLAKELGCTDVINPKDHPSGVPKILSEMTEGGVDYCFVSVGSVSAMEEAIISSQPEWGQTICIGVTELAAMVKMNVWQLLLGRRVRGTFGGSYKAKLEVKKLTDRILKGEIPLNKLVSHTIPLEDINHGFEMLKNGKCIRTVIDFSLEK